MIKSGKVPFEAFPTCVKFNKERMKEANELIPEASGVMYLVPKVFLESLLEKQNKIVEMLAQLTGKGMPEAVGDYVSEEQAKSMLGKKNTWFWMMRTKGYLSFTKVGRNIFYSKQELIRLLEGNNQPAFRNQLTHAGFRNRK